MTLLRPGLLEGRSVVLAGAVPTSVSDRLASLGATVSAYVDQADEERALEWARDAAPVNALVCSIGGGLEEVEDAWTAIRAVAVGALIPTGAGAVVLLAPRPDQVADADAVRPRPDAVRRMGPVRDHGHCGLARSNHHRGRPGDANGIPLFGRRGLLLRVPVRSRRPVKGGVALAGEGGVSQRHTRVWYAVGDVRRPW